MTSNITGKEYTVGKIFGDDFFFSIPPYQRPYSWTTEHAELLLDDLLTFVTEDDTPVQDIQPYFLGSIVLIKQDAPESEVVDGQQRLTTLTILLATMRSAVNDSDLRKAIEKYLYEEGKLIEGVSDRYRLVQRQRDEAFFREHIQTFDGMQQVGKLNEAQLSDAQKNLRANALLYLERLAKLTPDVVRRLAVFLITRCYLIVVSTPNLDSAYRIFSILNDRGMDLSHTDILKAETIGGIDETKRDEYTEKWEDLEDHLGRDRFQDLFAHVRMIYTKVKPRETLLAEFRKNVKPTEAPQHFIDNILNPYARSYGDIINADYKSGGNAEQVNAMLRWLNRIDNADWLPPAILFYAGNRNNHAELVRFFTDLERLAAGMMIERANVNKRMERYGKLLAAIEDGDDLYAPDSPMQLTEDEKAIIRRQLNGDIYNLYNVPRYVLLRLNDSFGDGAASYNYTYISIEHVLPQNPDPSSEWVTLFPNQEQRERLTHRLGNLVLLTRRKNSQARNYDFAKKKDNYFSTASGITSFPLTVQVLGQPTWTPDVIEQRQVALMERLQDIWRL